MENLEPRILCCGEIVMPRGTAARFMMMVISVCRKEQRDGVRMSREDSLISESHVAESVQLLEPHRYQSLGMEKDQPLACTIALITGAILCFGFTSCGNVISPLRSWTKVFERGYLLSGAIGHSRRWALT